MVGQKTCALHETFYGENGFFGHFRWKTAILKISGSVDVKITPVLKQFCVQIVNNDSFVEIAK